MLLPQRGVDADELIDPFDAGVQDDVVVERERVAVDGLGVAASVAAPVEGDLGQLGLGGAELVIPNRAEDLPTLGHLRFGVLLFGKADAGVE